jgi:non-ribosomal peptide synthetase component E (peptide arylation enzyme)
VLCHRTGELGRFDHGDHMVVIGPDVANLRSFLDVRGAAKFKVPEQVVIWETFPRNDASKVLKEKIRKSLAASS